MSIPHHFGALPPGKTKSIFEGPVGAAGVSEATLAIDSDSLLVTVYVRSITGTLDLKVYTFDDQGEELEIITFPTLSATTTELLLKKAAASLSNIRFEATYSGACDFKATARGISAGETSVKITGAGELKASQTTVGTSAQLVIAAALTDRQGLVLKNWNQGSGILYLGGTVGEATVANGYPLVPGEAIAIDIEAGQELYGIGSESIDTRIMEAGV